jgi:hypothetical protein
VVVAVRWPRFAGTRTVRLLDRIDLRDDVGAGAKQILPESAHAILATAVESFLRRKERRNIFAGGDIARLRAHGNNELLSQRPIYRALGEKL